ncbi:MAG: hypothetical protein PVG03_09810 [Desulfarculaceae bacterium]|jgi:lysine-ketoglutarate reductase/saccharopine dehydrogenase-like protein (TIGR00300 family)
MAFRLPLFRQPDFSQPPFTKAPLVKFTPVEKAGVAPENYHATSIFPEYLHLQKGKWVLVPQSRMDCAVVREGDDTLVVREFRLLQKGDQVACGREENAEQGIYVHTEAFETTGESSEIFAFRTRVTRESPFSIDYDELYDLMDYERRHGFIVWVLGPAVVFDADARGAMADLIRRGYVHALLAGNALAAHDLEAALFSTALGQEIYSKKTVHLGHYHHLDAINKIRGLGSIQKAVDNGLIKDGVVHAALAQGVPMALAGSIRDDGPLPEVIGNVYQAQDAMRNLVRKATTVIALATQLHSIATGNMVPTYQIGDDGQVRPVYFYIVDMSEFAASKLANRGSLAARTILTNVQDFVVTAARGLSSRYGDG